VIKKNADFNAITPWLPSSRLANRAAV
jgi:hypothetical protein